MLKRRRDPAAVNSRLIRRPIQRMFWLFLLPMTGAFCIGFMYPFLKGLFLSFCKFKTTSKWTWVGLANYGKAFADESFRYSFGYTAIFAIVSLIIINVLAFAVAYALTQGIKGTNVHAGYIDYGFEGNTLLHSGKYIKYPKNSNCQRWMKQETSRKFRNCQDLPRKGNYYRCLFDYWWTLY